MRIENSTATAVAPNADHFGFLGIIEQTPCEELATFIENLGDIPLRPGGMVRLEDLRRKCDEYQKSEHPKPTTNQTPTVKTPAQTSQPDPDAEPKRVKPCLRCGENDNQ